MRSPPRTARSSPRSSSTPSSSSCSSRWRCAASDTGRSARGAAAAVACSSIGVAASSPLRGHQGDRPGPGRVRYRVGGPHAWQRAARRARATLVTLILTVSPSTAHHRGRPRPLSAGARQPRRGRARGVVGSELIAQPFASAPYLQPRPSAAARRATTGPRRAARTWGNFQGTAATASRRTSSGCSRRPGCQRCRSRGARDRFPPAGLDPHLTPKPHRGRLPASPCAGRRSERGAP